MKKYQKNRNEKLIDKLQAWIQDHRSEFIQVPIARLPIGTEWLRLPYILKSGDRFELLLPNELFTSIAGTHRKAKRLKRTLKKRGWLVVGTRGVMKRVLFADGTRKYVVVLKADKFVSSRQSTVPRKTLRLALKSPASPQPPIRILPNERKSELESDVMATILWTKEFLRRDRARL